MPNAREKLIEKINTKLMALPWGQITPHTAEEIADSLIVDGYVTDTNVGEWISVKDRLPENYQKALCIMQYDGEFRVLRWNYIDYMWNTGIEWFKEKDVTHWMPLPEAPKGE